MKGRVCVCAAGGVADHVLSCSSRTLAVCVWLELPKAGLPPPFGFVHQHNVLQDPKGLISVLMPDTFGSGWHPVPSVEHVGPLLPVLCHTCGNLALRALLRPSLVNTVTNLLEYWSRIRACAPMLIWQILTTPARCIV